MSNLIQSAQAAAPVANPNTSGLQSLKDFTDINKIVSADNLRGVNTDLAGMGEKMKDLGAKFKDGDAAKNLFDNIRVPPVPTYDKEFGNLKVMMERTDFQANLNAMSGTGTGPLGLPNMQDFMEPVAAGGAIDALLANPNNIDLNAITNISAMVSKSQSLFNTAGVDVAATPPKNLGTLIQSATSLHKIGAETNGIGSANILNQLVMPNSEFGDAIKLSMAEGKNLKAMAAAGIAPPSYNPFENLPAGGDVDLSTQSAQKLLSGG